MDEIRGVRRFFSRSAARGGMRVCVIDSADAMNRNASNALLKTLEEPPEDGAIFLTAHCVGLVPVTILSRCRVLRLAPLGDEEVLGVLKSARPDMDGEAAARAALLARGSPGRALAIAAFGGLELHDRFCGLLGSLPRTDPDDLESFTGLFSGVEESGRESFRLFEDFLARWQSEAARGGTGFARGLEGAFRLWDKTARIFSDRARLNMDRKQAALAVMLTLEEEAERLTRQAAGAG